jgi:hypothetical protein
LPLQLKILSEEFIEKVKNLLKLKLEKFSKYLSKNFLNIEI